MKRVLVFEGDRVSDRFDVAWFGLHVGRVHLIADSDGKQTRSDRQKDLALLRLLRSGSVDAPDVQEPDDSSGDGKRKMRAKYPKLPTGDAQRLVTEGARVELSQEQLDRLVALIDRVAWDTSRLEFVEDTLDWLAAADKIDA